MCAKISHNNHNCVQNTNKNKPTHVGCHVDSGFASKNSQTISEDDFESETSFAEIRFKISAKSKTGFGFISKWNAPSYMMFECNQKAQKIGDRALQTAVSYQK